MLQLLNNIKNESSINGKIELIKEYSKYEVFKKVLELAYNPFYNFYIKKLPEIEHHSGRFTLEYALDILEYQIATRNITGNNAKEELLYIMRNLTPNDCKVVRLILERDLDCGISVKTINKAIPNFIPDTKKLYMRCSNFSEKLLNTTYKDVDYVYIQEKMDGMYCNLVLQQGKNPEFITRNGKKLPLFENNSEIFTYVLQDLPKNVNKVLQGELLFVNNLNEIQPREVGNGLFQSKNKKVPKGWKPIYIVWDIVDYDDWLKGYSNVTYEDRYAELEQYSTNFNDIYLVTSVRASKDLDNINRFLQDYIRQEKEGIVIKHPKGVWEGKTSKYQMKYKKEIEVDLQIYGITDGKNGARLGKPSILMCQSADGELKVDVGIGFTDEMYKYIENNVELLLNKVVTVKAFDIIETENGISLFLPRFVEFRFDKNEADDLKRIREISEMKGK
jgi:ATP-dependent DNA ligase